MSLHEIAMVLGEAYHWRKVINIEKAHQEADYNARLLVLTPIDGWTGKNDDQRKISKQKAESEDEALNAIRKRLMALGEDSEECEEKIATQIELRDAQRWAIREKLADALAARGETNPDEAADEPATEDAAEALAYVFDGEGQPPTFEEQAFEDNGEIPF